MKFYRAFIIPVAAFFAQQARAAQLLHYDLAYTIHAGSSGPYSSYNGSGNISFDRSIYHAAGTDFHLGADDNLTCTFTGGNCVDVSFQGDRAGWRNGFFNSIAVWLNIGPEMSENFGFLFPTGSFTAPGSYSYNYPNAAWSGNLTVTAAGNAGGVPEPATWALMILGFGMIGYALRQRAVTRYRAAWARSR